MLACFLHLFGSTLILFFYHSPNNTHKYPQNIVPIAVPLLAGPSTLAMLILLARSQPDRIFDWLIAVLGAWGVTSLIILSSTSFHKILGNRGLMAVEKLMGMVLVAISVQMLVDGITTYLKALS